MGKDYRLSLESFPHPTIIIKIMRLNIHYRGKLIHLDIDGEKATVKDILEKLNLSKDYAFVVVNGEIAEENQAVSPQDDIRVVNAISGG